MKTRIGREYVCKQTEVQLNVSAYGEPIQLHAAEDWQADLPSSGDIYSAAGALV